MDSIMLRELSDDLYKLTFILNSKLLNPYNYFKQCSMPVSHMKVIFYLAHCKASSVSKIGKDLGISKPNMTPIIDKLLSEGLVERNYSKSDRRIIVITLTQNAFDLLESHKDFLKKLLQDKISSLSSDDILALSSATKSIYNIISKL